MRIELYDGFHLTEVREGDQPALVEHFSDKRTSDRLLRIPYPYTPGDADKWVRHCVGAGGESRLPHQFACRQPDGYLVGGTGLQLNLPPTSAHRAELGYWIAKHYRGRGLATGAARAMVDYGFRRLELKRIEATVNLRNFASHRVLEKAGLHREARLAGYYLKHGKLIDVYLYAVLKSAHS